MIAQASVPEPILALMISGVVVILGGLAGPFIYLRVHDLLSSERAQRKDPD